jgi:hypothetical protein
MGRIGIEVRAHDDRRRRIPMRSLRSRGREHPVPADGCIRQPVGKRGRRTREVSRSGVTVESASRAAGLSPNPNVHRAISREVDAARDSHLVSDPRPTLLVSSSTVGEVIR